MMGIDGGMSDGMGGLCPVLSSEKAIDEHLNAKAYQDRLAELNGSFVFQDL